jgi:hypothetical protein
LSGALGGFAMVSSGVRSGGMGRLNNGRPYTAASAFAVNPLTLQPNRFEMRKLEANRG